MITLVLDPRSVDETVDYLEHSRQRILAAVKEGMLEAMEGLAGEAVAKFYEAGLKSQTGQTVENIEASPEVTSDEQRVRGRVSAERDITLGGRKSKHIGLWFQEGYHVPEVRDRRKPGSRRRDHARAGDIYQFTEPDGSTFWTTGHKAFDVRPHPFLNPALEQYGPAISEIIQRRIDEALAS